MEEEKKERDVCIHTRSKNNIEIELERKKYDDHLDSCCGKTSDKRLLIFISSLLISLISLFFSCFQLTRGLECSQETVYIGIITSIISIWIPSPIHTS